MDTSTDSFGTYLKQHWKTLWGRVQLSDTPYFFDSILHHMNGNLGIRLAQPDGRILCEPTDDASQSKRWLTICPVIVPDQEEKDDPQLATDVRWVSSAVWNITNDEETVLGSVESPEYAKWFARGIKLTTLDVYYEAQYCMRRALESYRSKSSKSSKPSKPSKSSKPDPKTYSVEWQRAYHHAYYQKHKERLKERRKKKKEAQPST